MRRSRLEALLHDYAAGDLDDNCRREVERRLANEPATRALYEEVRAAQDALKLLRERPEPPVAARDVLPRIHAAIAAQAFETRPRLYLEGMGTRYYRRMAVAATLLFAVTVGYVALVRDQGPSPGTTRVGMPSAVGMDRVVELGSRRDGIPADEFYRILEELQADPGELPSVAPVINVLPVVEGR